MPRAFLALPLGASLLATALSAQAPSLRNATAIAVGDSVQGQLTAESPFYDQAGGIRYAAYRLRASGRTVRATLRSVIFDSFLEVRKVTADSTELVGEDDDGGGNLDSQFSWDADGEYLLIVRHFGEGETGAFSLVVEEPPPPPVVIRGLAPGISVTERFRAHDRTVPDGRRMHEYLLALGAGQRVAISLSAEGAEIALQVHRAGEVLALTGSDATEPLVFNAPTAGTFSVHVLGAVSERGAYTLSVSRAP